MSKSRGNFLDPNDFVAAFGSDGARYVVLREVPFDRDAEVSLGLVRAALQRRPRQRFREPRQPHRVDDQPVSRRRAAGAARGRRLAAGRLWATTLGAYRDASTACLAARGAGRAVDVRRRGQQGRSTPSSRGSWRRPPRPATMRRRRGFATCSATSSRPAGWSGSRRRRSCRRPRRGCSPSSGTPTRMGRMATAARRSSTSSAGVPTPIDGRGRTAEPLFPRLDVEREAPDRRRLSVGHLGRPVTVGRAGCVSSTATATSTPTASSSTSTRSSAAPDWPASSGSSSRAGTSRRRVARSTCVDRFDVAGRRSRHPPPRRGQGRRRRVGADHRLGVRPASRRHR